MRVKTVCGKEFLINKKDLHFLDNGHIGISGCEKPYVKITTWNRDSKKYSYQLLHRLILGAKKGQIVDHINCNRMDNRRSNLRFVSKKQNAWNTSKHSNSYSKYKGVVFYRDKFRRKPWAARINNKLIGFFETERKAAIAYNIAIKDSRGEFAYLNKVLK